MANKRFIDFPIATTVGDNDIILIWQGGANKQTTKATILSEVPDSLNDLTDVTISGLTNGQILRYDSVTGQWENTDQGNLDLNDLNDVTIVSPTNGQVLVYNSSTSKWENSSGGYVPYVGAVTTVDLGLQGLEAGYVRFDTSIVSVPDEQGLMYWDASRSTVALIMNGTLQHIGQDTFFYVKNSTGSSIPKGTCVRFAGTDGASGHLLITPFLANGSVPSTYFLGVTAEEITNGSFGQVMHFGELEGINTSSYTAGDLLYASTTVAGAFQTTAPVAPNNIVLVAAAVNSKNNGAIVVRPTYGSNINNDEGVKITSPTTGQLLQLQAGGLWENKTLAQVLGGTSSQFVKGDGSLDSTSYGTGTVTSVGLSSATSGVTIGSTPVTTSGTITLAIATASGSQNGLLSSADWSTFNSKQNALTLTTSGTSGAATLVGATLNIPQYQAAGTYVNSVTASSPLASSGGTTPNITIQQASASQNGFLSSTDWTTFNSKVSSQWITSGSNIYYNSGNVLIGTTTNNGETLQVTGNTRINGGALRALRLDVDTGVAALNIGGTGSIIVDAPGIGGGRFILNDAGNFLIATTSDNGARLQVSGLSTFNHNDAPTIKIQRNGGSDNNTVIEFTNASRSFFIGSNGTVFGLGGTTGSLSSQPLQISSTGAATFSSSVTANSFIKSGGTSSQYLMADGSVSTLTNPVTGTGVNGRVAIWNGSSTITSDGDLLFSGTELNVSGIKIDGSSVPYIISTLAGNDLNIQFPVGQGLAINNNGAENIARIIKNNFTLIGASTIQTSTGNLTISTGGGNGNIILSPNGTGTTTINSNVTASSFIRSGGTSSQYLMADGSVSTLTNPVTGTGTTNYLPKFTGSTTIGNSPIYVTNGGDVYLNNAAALFFGPTSVTYLTGSTTTMTFAVNDSPRMSIFSDGNVLIQSGGTFTNNGARLQVSGTSTFSGTATFSLDIIVNGVNVGRGGGNFITSTRVGVGALQANTTGEQNTAVGESALVVNTTGSNNSSFGRMSLFSNTSGSANTAIGTAALNSNTTGIYNSGFGFAALGNNTTGNYNTGVGNFAGTSTNAGSNNTTSSDSVYLGYDTRASASGNTNEIVIGSGGRGQGSNTAVIGNTSITKTILNGNVGIGQVSPAARLHVEIPSESPASGNTGLLVRTGNGANDIFRWFDNATPLGVIKNNGNLLVGTISDNGAKLQVSGSASINGGASNALRLDANNGVTALSIGGTGSIRVDFPGVGAGRLELNDSGTLFLRQYSNGTLSISSGQVVSSSDKSLKNDDGNIENALEKILQLNPRYFYWKKESGIETNERQLGFYAQEVNEALGKEVANNNSNGKWGIYDRGIIAMLTKAIQELKQEIDTLKN